MKFKVGDRVRVVGDDSYRIPQDYWNGAKGNVYTVMMADGFYKLDDESGFSYCDEMLEPAPFGKSDLKTGMQVRTNAGRLYMALENIDTKVYGKQQFILANFEGGFLCGSDYDDELKHVDRSKCDIAEVYGVPATRSILEPLRYAAPIWKREEEPIGVTIKEIADWKGVSPERIRIRED